MSSIVFVSSDSWNVLSTLILVEDVHLFFISSNSSSKFKFSSNTFYLELLDVLECLSIDFFVEESLY